MAGGASPWRQRTETATGASPASTRRRMTGRLSAKTPFETARLLASLELHAEGVSMTEAVDSFERRTGVDPWTALVEVRLAQHDPLSGIGYLGFHELRAFESSLAEVFSEELALSGSLFLVLSSPNLRPVDQRGMIAGLLTRRMGGKGAMVLPKNLLRR